MADVEGREITLQDGRKLQFLIKKNVIDDVTVTYRLAFDITDEKHKNLVIIGTYETEQCRKAFITEDPRIMRALINEKGSEITVENEEGKKKLAFFEDSVFLAVTYREVVDVTDEKHPINIMMGMYETEKSQKYFTTDEVMVWKTYFDVTTDKSKLDDLWEIMEKDEE